MKLGTRGRYAVMAVVDVLCHSKGGPVSLAEISQRQNISLSYLEQIFHKLKKKQIVRSVRGVNGGYLLNRAAEEITVAQIILSVDEPLHTVRCVPRSGTGCMNKGARCLTHELWEALDHHIHQYLNMVTVRDVQARRFSFASGSTT